MGELVYCEFLKLKRSKMKRIALLGTMVTPLISVSQSIGMYVLKPDYQISLFTLFESAFMFWMLLFGLLIFSVIASYIFSREYTEKTLKTLFAVPISKKSYMQCKFLTLFLLVSVLMLLSWAYVLISGIALNMVFGISEFYVGMALLFLWRFILGGILLYFSIAPIALVALYTKGIIAPMLTASVIVLANVIFSALPLSSFLPWAASYYIASGNSWQMACPSFVSLVIIFLIFMISYKGCIFVFEKEDI